MSEGNEHLDQIIGEATSNAQRLQVDAENLKSGKPPVPTVRDLSTPGLSPVPEAKIMSPAEDESMDVASLSRKAQETNERMITDARSLQSNPVKAENVKSQGGLKQALIGLFGRTRQ